MCSDTSSLKGQLLLATPAIADPRFHHAVILICSHNENGAMGLVLNNVLANLSFENIAEQLNVIVADSKNLNNIPILGGGPIETARGFVLHESNLNMKDTIKLSDELSLTGTIDIVKAIIEGTGPEPFLFILGYAGWDAGQLEKELEENAWLTLTPDHALIFEIKPESKWQLALAKLGIDPTFLSADAGHA